MMHTFKYKSGHIHETIEGAFHSIRWQCGFSYGHAKSVHAAKMKITREENRKPGEPETYNGRA